MEPSNAKRNKYKAKPKGRKITLPKPTLPIEPISTRKGFDMSI
jgi:hypothetical protein